MMILSALALLQLVIVTRAQQQYTITSSRTGQTRPNRITLTCRLSSGGAFPADESAVFYRINPSNAESDIFSLGTDGNPQHQFDIDFMNEGFFTCGLGPGESEQLLLLRELILLQVYTALILLYM